MDLNDYLALLKISRAQAARELGCDPALLWRWCAGITLPGRHWWPRIQAWSHGAITADVPKRKEGEKEKVNNV